MVGWMDGWIYGRSDLWIFGSSELWNYGSLLSIDSVISLASLSSEAFMVSMDSMAIALWIYESGDL
jgi:hypothetical protein